jgi:hypothetical protein
VFPDRSQDKSSRTVDPSPSGVARLVVDMSRWPLVVLTHAGQPTDEQLAAHLDEIERTVLARRAPFVQVIDQSRGEMPSPQQRALIAAHQAKMDEFYARYCRGEAYVVAPAIRGAMVAVFWIAKPPYPYVFVDSLDEALEWARRALVPPMPAEVGRPDVVPPGGDD